MIIDLTTSAFASTSLQWNIDEDEVRWQIWIDTPPSEGDGQNDPNLIYDSWFIAASYTFIYNFALYTGPWYARVQYRDNYGIISDWSDPIAYVPDPIPEPEPAEDPCPTDPPDFLDESVGAVYVTTSEGCGTRPTLYSVDDGVLVPLVDCPPR